MHDYIGAVNRDNRITKFEQNCPICDNKFRLGHEYIELRCGNYFHINCIREKIHHKKECSLCNQYIDPNFCIEYRKKRMEIDDEHVEIQAE